MEYEKGNLMIFDLKEAIDSVCQENPDFLEGYLAGRTIASYESLSSILDVVHRYNKGVMRHEDEKFQLWKKKCQEAEELRKELISSK